MAKVIWSQRSLDDINEVAEFIAKDSFQYASEQTSTFFEKASQLESYPYMGRVVPELNTSSIRQILCGSYRLIYEVVNEEEVYILTIHHQARLIENNPAFEGKKTKD
jgi:plasmid stabilization system protein ParE